MKTHDCTRLAGCPDHPRWRLCRYTNPAGWWFVYPPQDESGTRCFPTHAEALTFAHDQARRGTQGQSDWLAAKIGLIASEAHEAIEVLRNGNGSRDIYHTINGQVVYPVTDGSGADWTKDANGTSGDFTWTGVAATPRGVPIELADVIIRTLDLVDLLGIDIQTAINLKLAYNAKKKS